MRIFGVEPRRNPDVYERVGVVPDQSPPWPFLTAHDVVQLCARLHKVADPDAAARRTRSRRSASPMSRSGRWAASRTACASA